VATSNRAVDQLDPAAKLRHGLTWTADAIGQATATIDDEHGT
jgi:hypothetical protein